jgi:hypothetical protein
MPRRPGAPYADGDGDDAQLDHRAAETGDGPRAPRGRRVSETFTTYLLSRNIRMEEDLVDQLFNSSEKRLARLLLLLANFGKEGRPEPVVPRISQETRSAPRARGSAIS